MIPLLASRASFAEVEDYGERVYMYAVVISLTHIQTTTFGTGYFKTVFEIRREQHTWVASFIYVDTVITSGEDIYPASSVWRT